MKMALSICWCIFGAAAISPWLRDAGFDPVRETVEFRSFADRVVGSETRKAIEEINKREAEKTTPVVPDDRREPKTLINSQEAITPRK